MFISIYCLEQWRTMSYIFYIYIYIYIPWRISYMRVPRMASVPRFRAIVSRHPGGLPCRCCRQAKASAAGAQRKAGAGSCCRLCVKAPLRAALRYSVLRRCRAVWYSEFAARRCFCGARRGMAQAFCCSGAGRQQRACCSSSGACWRASAAAVKRAAGSRLSAALPIYVSQRVRRHITSPPGEQLNTLPFNIIFISHIFHYYLHMLARAVRPCVLSEPYI